MHTTLRINKEPLIILSEDCSYALSQKLKELVTHQNLSGRMGLVNFVEALKQYSLLVPGLGYPFDVDYYFEKNPQDLKLLIDLIPQAVDELQKKEPLAESKIIDSLRKYLIAYLQQLTNSSNQ